MRIARGYRSFHMEVPEIISLFGRVVDAVRKALDGMDGDWGLSGDRDTQYRHDVVADRAALEILADADVTIVSEETGVHNPGREVTVVIDPVDGSTNASMGLPWYAVSLCAVSGDEAIVARVDNLATGTTFEAVRSEGATMDGRRIHASGVAELADSIVATNGFLGSPLGSRQFRTLGATALDMCFVGAGRLDGYLDCTTDEVAPWDYLGALLVCQEAGAHCADVFGRDLVVTDHDARRTPVVAGSAELLASLLAKRSLG